MFGFFKKKKENSADNASRRGEPIISALLIESETYPIDAFVKQVAKKRFFGHKVEKVDESENGVVAFQIDDELVGIIAIAAPYPATDLEGPIATSWMWPDSPPIESVKNHKSHVLITMTGGAADPIKRRLLQTAVTASAAKQPGVVAVYWPEATLVHYPSVFIEMAEKINSPDAPPLYLWVDQRIFHNPDGTTGLFTTGLKPLGHKEMEIPRIDMSPGELREWLTNIMYYLIENGPVLKHGETIGMTADQMIRIRHCASSFGHKGKVIRLEP